MIASAYTSPALRKENRPYSSTPSIVYIQFGQADAEGTADAIYQNLGIMRRHEPEHALVLALGAI